MFDELTFIPHRGLQNTIQAKKHFDNGCMISVVSGDGMYGNIDVNDFYKSTFEVAAFDNNNEFIRLTPSDDVIGHRTKTEVNEIMTALRDDPESLRVDATDS